MPMPDVSAAPAAPPAGDPVYTQGTVVGYRRTPRDLLRVVVYGVVALVLLALTRWASDAVLGLEDDLIRLITFLNPTTERILAGFLQVLVAVTTIVIWLTPLITKRYRLFGYIVVANIATFALAGAGVWWLDRSSPDLVNEIADRAGIDSRGFPDVWALGQLAAAFVVLSPFVTRRWRQAGVATYTLIVVLRLVTSVHLPAELFFAIAVGAMVGALVLFMFGRPDERPTNDQVLAALRLTGLPLASLDPAKVDARGSTPYFGTLEDGGRIFAKVLGSEERSADLLFRMYRYLRFRNLGDERPFSSLRRAVEHEAFVSLQARDLDVRTPRMRAVSAIGADSFLLAYDRIEGQTLDTLDPATVDDELLRRIWDQIALLRAHRIAHRDLRRANILIDPDGRPWLIDFGFAEVAASEALLAADLAQTLSALAVIVGASRAVDSAIATLGTDAVARSLPRLQMGALSGATQTALKQHSGLIEELQETIEDRTGTTEVEYEPIQRLNVRQLVVVVMLIGIVYLLAPQFADLPEIWANVKTARWVWLIPMLAASAVTYFGATLSFMGAIPDRLRLGPTIATQTGSSFVSKVAPAGLGGMALNVRYAQKAGVDPAVAVSGVGLNSMGGFVMHLVLTLLFIVWAGREAFGDFKLPDPTYLLIGIAVVLAMTVVSMAVPAVRKLVLTKLLPILQRSIHGVAAVLRSPTKLFLLLGGSAVVTLSYVVAFYFSTEAFGGDLRFATVGAAYLVGSAVATAAPTPGGLGAMEAALLAGLTAAGMDAAVALPAVFLYRLATFWLPILPGWACFAWLKRSDYI